MTLVSRDPFARTEIHRRLEPSGQGCNWCGSHRVHKGLNTLNLFRYYTETDDGRRHDHKGLFCSKSCHDAYHS